MFGKQPVRWPRFYPGVKSKAGQNEVGFWAAANALAAGLGVHLLVSEPVAVLSFHLYVEM